MPLFDEMKKMENIVPLFILSSIFYTRDLLFNAALTTQVAAWSYPIASVATVVVSGFFSRLKEDRDYKRHEEQGTQQVLLKSINESQALAHSFDQNRDFVSSLRHYQIAIDEFEKQYKKDKPGAATKRAELYYMQTLAAIELHNFDMAKNNLNKILVEMIDIKHVLYTSVLNLMALICIKLAKSVNDKPVNTLAQASDTQTSQNPARDNVHLQDAKNYLSQSLVTDGNQPPIRVLYEFLDGKYDVMLQHYPFNTSKGRVPYDIEEDIYQTAIYQAYAEAFVEQNKNQIANKISLLELALDRLPTEPTFYLERAFLLKACGDAYLSAGKAQAEGSTLKLTPIPIKDMAYHDERLKQERTLSSKQLIDIAKEKYRYGIDFIKDLKAVPISSHDGQTIYGIPKEAAIELERYFMQQLDQKGDVKDDFQLVATVTRQNSSYLSRATELITSDTAKTAGKYMLYAGGAALTLFVARNLDLKKCSDSVVSTVLNTGDDWCRFFMSKTPVIKNYMAVAPLVAVAPVTAQVVKEVLTDTAVHTNRK